MAALTPLDGGRIKKSRASLIGGIAVGIGVFVLWVAIARDLGAAGSVPLLLGALAGTAVGLWIWRADL
jgi:lipopolysaccharide export LptBFGC system permease protein LptF